MQPRVPPRHAGLHVIRNARTYIASSTPMNDGIHCAASSTGCGIVVILPRILG